MRVLHVLEAVEGGAVRHLGDLVAHVPVEHHVLAPSRRVGGYTDTSSLDGMVAAGALLHRVEMRRRPGSPHNALAVASVRRLRARLRPDVVHGHSSIGGVAARLGAAGNSTPVLYTPHGLLRRRTTLALERALGRLTERMIAVSQEEGEQIRQLGIVPADRLAVIPNGISLLPPAPAFNLRARLGIPEGAPLIGTLGRLAPAKAPEAFIRCCATIADAVAEARFVMIGEGPSRRSCEALIGRLGLEEKLTLLPGLQRAGTVLGQLDVFVSSSRSEAGPYAPLEAMRAGTPVVLTAVTGNREVIGEDDAGVLVAPDPDALARAVLQLLADPARRRQLVATGRERLRRCFDVELMARRVGELYAAVAERGPRPGDG